MQEILVKKIINKFDDNSYKTINLYIIPIIFKMKYYYKYNICKEINIFKYLNKIKYLLKKYTN